MIPRSGTRSNPPAGSGSRERIGGGPPDPSGQTRLTPKALDVWRTRKAVESLPPFRGEAQAPGAGKRGPQPGAGAEPRPAFFPPAPPSLAPSACDPGTLAVPGRIAGPPDPARRSAREGFLPAFAGDPGGLPVGVGGAPPLPRFGRWDTNPTGWVSLKQEQEPSRRRFAPLFSDLQLGSHGGSPAVHSGQYRKNRTEDQAVRSRFASEPQKERQCRNEA